MREEHHKLVRDKIPEIIEKSGCNYEIARLSEEEFRHALGEKLIEEAREAVRAIGDSPEKLLEELADLYEVIDALLEIAGGDRSALAREQQRKRELRGGFRQKIQLLWTEKSERAAGG